MQTGAWSYEGRETAVLLLLHLKHASVAGQNVWTLKLCS